MSGNTNLHTASKSKNDEFYTQLSDIENELKHYREQFCDKVILCNCDDPYESNFFKYFAMNFNFLRIKKLIATCYATSPVSGNEISFFDIPGFDGSRGANDGDSDKKPYKIEITEVCDYNGDGAVDLADVEYLLKNDKNTLSLLEGDGDFSSDECTELLKQADIVVTNPPFSLFREYIATLVKYDKKFIVIGNTNALTYKEIFTLIKENRLRTGYTNFNVGMYFYVPDSWEKYHKIENGRKLVRVSTSCWFTNMEVKKHKENLILFKYYNPEDYPKYDNYDAINVNTYVDIPCDYDGVMGVPITFLDKYNPNQFEIVKFRKGNDDKDLSINGKCPYFRILIKKK
ncbi:MAG: adenine-specific methyltransferase EcoRI family protein [Clostridia bacterium]|nr:adenine-specific methyltransferase EcoRI family protein [Clostridia bacterium]